MTYSVQYHVAALDMWFEWQNVNDPKEAEKLEAELKATFKTRIVSE